MTRVIQTARATQWTAAGAIVLAFLALTTRPASAQTAPGILGIPNETVVPGGTVTVPLDLSVTSSTSVSAYQVTITYNPNVFTFVSASNGSLDTTNIFTPNPPGVVGPSSAGGGLEQVTVEAFAGNGSGLPLTPTTPLGSLFNVTFTENAASGATSSTVSANALTAGNFINNPPGANIASNNPTGTITIQAVPEPVQFVLLGVLAGLGGGKLGWNRLRRSRAMTTS